MCKGTMTNSMKINQDDWGVVGMYFLDNSSLILYLEVLITNVRTYFCDWKL